MTWGLIGELNGIDLKKGKNEKMMKQVNRRRIIKPIGGGERR